MLSDVWMENTFFKAVSTHRGNSYQDSRSLPTCSRFTSTLSEPRGSKQLQNTVPCHVTATRDEREDRPGLHPPIWITVDGPWPPWQHPLCFSAQTEERRGLGAITALSPHEPALCRVYVLCKSTGEEWCRTNFSLCQSRLGNLRQGPGACWHFVYCIG